MAIIAAAAMSVAARRRRRPLFRLPGAGPGHVLLVPAIRWRPRVQRRANAGLEAASDSSGHLTVFLLRRLKPSKPGAARQQGQAGQAELYPCRATRSRQPIAGYDVHRGYMWLRRRGGGRDRGRGGGTWTGPSLS